MAWLTFSKHKFRVEKANTMIDISALALTLLLKNAKQAELRKLGGLWFVQ